MQSRAVIEQAKGVLVGQRRCTPQEAFDILVKLSQDTNRKLRDVAQVLNSASGASTPSPQGAPAVARCLVGVKLKFAGRP